MPSQKKTEHETFAAAIAAAQLEMCNASKNAKNPHFKTDYANLSAVRDVVQPAFNRHGIAVLTIPSGDPGFMNCRTILMWKDQTLEVGNKTYDIGTGRNEPQQGGTALTYYRRQSLASVGGIAQEDDDAESYKAPQRQQQRKPVSQGPPAQDGPNCPECSSVLKVNINYRAWLKTLSADERKQAKDKPALCCSNWKNCDYKKWSTDEAQQALQELNTFDDGMNDA